MTFACMTPDEYALWSRQVARARVVRPCYDCPQWFAREAQAEGCCDQRPGLGRPRAPARAKGYNDADEYSVPIAHNAQRPSARLYSGSEGVDVPEYRRNAT